MANTIGRDIRDRMTFTDGVATCSQATLWTFGRCLMSRDGLAFKSVSKRFGTVEALSNVSLLVPPGHVFGLLGENGAGKSTFIHLAAGVLPPSSGSIEVPAGTVGWCAQRQMIDWFVDCRTNVWLGARLAGLTGRAAWEASDRALEQVNLTGAYLSRTPEVLSGGQQQRLMIARTLAMKADLLLLDEPTVGLDALNVGRLTSAIIEARNAGAIVVVSSHEFENVEPVLDEVGFLDEGRVVFQGTVASFVNKFVSEEVVTLRFSSLSEVNIECLAALEGEVLNFEPASSTVELRAPRSLGIGAITARLPDFLEVLEVVRRPASLRDAVVAASGRLSGSGDE
ncbi:ABC transporter ATP-binding protein [Micropruina sp.]|uniref:ABC transporter ATP-binding protein n=1 Tax=Micropruina sp. TaxID=2737536 RepID=UPI0039E49ADC